MNTQDLTTRLSYISPNHNNDDSDGIRPTAIADYDGDDVDATDNNCNTIV